MPRIKFAPAGVQRLWRSLHLYTVIVNAQPNPPSAPSIVVVIQPTCTVATGRITVNAPSGLLYSLDSGPYEVYPLGGYVVTAGAHSIMKENVTVEDPNR